MDYTDIENVLADQPKFRVKQVKKAVFSDLIDDWAEATTLPAELRKELAEKIPLSELKDEKILESRDERTTKALFILKDGLKIESVLMRHEDGRNTVCVSSQVGCAMCCQFCATGQQGLKRNLISSEIIDQVLFFARLLKKSPHQNKYGTGQAREKISNTVFMGMGEPMLNYENVLGAVKVLNDKDGMNIGARHISISTSGIPEGIKKLAKENLQINLAVSLHAPDDELRSKLMPVNKSYSIEKVLGAVDKYIEKTNRRVMFEYLMIDGVNDGREQAEKLAILMKKPLYFVNLISFNPVGHSDFRPSPALKIRQFKEILEKKDVAVTQRYKFGDEIKAACGQLAGEDASDKPFQGDNN